MFRSGSLRSNMQHRTKETLLVLCLFLFSFVVLGGGLHLSPSGAFLAALTGTPLFVHAFNVWNRRPCGAAPSSHRIMTLHARDASSAETENLVRR
jgi:hypothetical protein